MCDNEQLTEEKISHESTDMGEEICNLDLGTPDEILISRDVGNENGN